MTSDGGGLRRGMCHAVAASVLLVVGACASAPPDGTRQYLDEKSAATVTLPRASLVFARERPELAVHARDYLTLVPIDVNRMGTHALYFYGFVWSTIDKRGVVASNEGAAQFEIIADGRRIPLVPVTATPRELGLAEQPVRPPSRSAQLLIARTDRQTLEFLATAGAISAAEVRDDVSDAYELWSGDPRALLTLR